MNIYYHLPGLFEFYELYKAFLPLWREHREYFYEWCEIGSIYGAPSDCIWGGGRVGFGEGNYPYIIKNLSERNYDGFMTLEPHTWKFALNKKRVYEENIRIGEDSDMFNAFKLIDNKLGLKEDEYLSRKDVYILQYNNLLNLIKEYAK